MAECKPLIPCEQVDGSVRLYHDIHSENDASLTVNAECWGKNEVDLTPMVQAAETETCMHKDDPNERIVYESEDYVKGLQKNPDCVTGKEIAAWINLEDLKDVTITNNKTGDTIYWDGTKWVNYNLKEQIDRLNTRIDNLNTKLDNHIKVFNDTVASINQNIANLTTRVNNLTDRVSDIEKLIVDYPADKNTKIARGNINVYSGAFNSDKLIRGHSGNATSNDLRFE